ncbi:SGNH/GDSL hydrolase family protein [Carboxylicivirga linearis]|uniref:SGNH/GDSL hydrolase family protein n=1 Tax=Carboxylicivirga linearis TaxID=1628157 RepID=A0ABS5K130_9BACT|nr:SGNH/GDSL hydrolase family protein [Carboxylicivirga linearis]MBS2100760.1 SGNH/GDSL hydrolase family protein [Carboxylicivirga linearis]
MKNKSKSNKVWLFRILSISFSLLLILLFELILRLVGYGHNYDLFVESETYPDYYVMNDFASEKFFMSEEQATIGYYEPFLKEKSKDTYRIFVLGESTTVGFPYGFNGSFHRWLKYRLMFTFPDVNFEIINLSLTAVNSYTIADFAEELVDYDPDAVLIYVGHNEYYGALGVGSTLKVGNNPKIVKSIIRLRELKLFQLVYNIVDGFGDKDDKISEKSLMQHMPADKKIAYESEKYWQAIDQFKYNINLTLEVLNEEAIPVFISNLVSNEKDLKPFISDADSEYSALKSFERAWEFYNNNDFKEAKKLFVKAKEYDLLRFRAPEGINEEIKKIANSYNHVEFVDAKSRFEQASPHGIIGNETLLEHVHPNLYGYALLSDAFFNKIKENQLVDKDWSAAMSFEQLLDEMPVNEVDSLKGAYQIDYMLNEWPFTNNPKPKQNLIDAKSELQKDVLKYTLGETSWDKVQGKLYTSELKRGNKKEALKISEAFALINPLEASFLKKAALLSMNAQNMVKAAFYYSKEFKLHPTVAGAQQLSESYTQLDMPEEALKYYNYIVAASDNGEQFADKINVLKEIVKKKKDLKSNDDHIDILNKLAWDYIQLRNTELARKYFLMALSIDSKNKETVQIGQILSQELKEGELANEFFDDIEKEKTKNYEFINTDCGTFKVGKFKYQMPDGTFMIIERDPDFQYEYYKGTTTKYKLKWLDDCRYSLSMIETNSKSMRAAKGQVFITNIYETGVDFYKFVSVIQGQELKIDGVVYLAE